MKEIKDKIVLNLELEDITKDDFKDILELTSNEDVMKYIGNSKIWDDKNVNNFIKYCLDDEKNKDNKRENYYYKIISHDDETLNKIFIGVIGFRKFYNSSLFTTRNEFYLTVYMNPKEQGKGYYNRAIELLIKKMRKHQPRKTKLYLLVRQSNEKMNLISKKKYNFINEVKINQEKLNHYYIDLGLKLNFKYNSRIASSVKKNKITKITRKITRKTNKKLSGMISRKTNKKITRNITRKNEINKEKKHYYLAFAKNVDENRIDKIFQKRGNWVKYNVNRDKGKQIDYIYIDHQDNIYRNKKVHSYKSFLKNFIDENKHVVGHKDELYKNLGDTLKKNPSCSLKNYLLEQHNFNWQELYNQNKVEKTIEYIKGLFDKNKGKVWIYKPVAGFAGQMIEIFKSFDEFYQYITQFIEKQKDIWVDPKFKKKARLKVQSNWVLQEYINEPILFENKKFHIRPIFLYQKKGNRKIGYLLNRILVAHARKDYILDDFGNKDIHDSHFGKSSRRIYFQDDFLKLKILTKKEIEHIEEQVKDLGKYVFDLINSRCYPENKECYETFGMDIMIDSTLTIKVLEVQITNISYGFFDDDKLPGYSNIFEYILENAVETVVDPYFPPKNTIKKIGDFQEIYNKNIN